MRPALQDIFAEFCVQQAQAGTARAARRVACVTASMRHVVAEALPAMLSACPLLPSPLEGVADLGDAARHAVVAACADLLETAPDDLLTAWRWHDALPLLRDASPSVR